ncbi:MAG TPA: SDR family oxidoreductase [Thermoanaerobaculia bacterium]|jgi:short-subunit dehydrogenase|nr:SDR family oxidoreductase [Thermoanaerobaculia bacterium]
MDIELKPLPQQVIVITGASSGIGLATAKKAAAKGAKVVLAARNEPALQQIGREIEAAGGTALSVVADVGNVEDLERIARTAVDTFGRVDTWVNNAGTSIYGRLEEVSEEDNRRLFDINFWGVVNGSLIGLRCLETSGAALINVGSELSDVVAPLQGMYSATKHAVKGFTDALRIEVAEIAGRPVSITLIQPTAVDTPFPQHARNYMAREPKLPDPKIQPEEVADAILDAAENPRRDVKVGTRSKIDTTMWNLVPSLVELMVAKQSDEQHYEELPRNPEGILFGPGEDGRIHGSGGVEENPKQT